jgi:hypothetical protein
LISVEQAGTVGNHIAHSQAHGTTRGQLQDTLVCHVRGMSAEYTAVAQQDHPWGIRRVGRVGCDHGRPHPEHDHDNQRLSYRAVVRLQYLPGHGRTVPAAAACVKSKRDEGYEKLRDKGWRAARERGVVVMQGRGIRSWVKLLRA